MQVFRTEDVRKLSDFPKRQDKLAIASRTVPDGADVFFQKLMQTSFSAIGQVFKESANEDIAYILEDSISKKFQADPFYAFWVSDMAEVSRTFCDTLNSKGIGFCLGTIRSCQRYHIDNVPMRMLVTYAGQGTEWLPDEAADRKAFANGASNEEIVKDHSARQFMQPWDVSIFRGGPKGLLHRTPDSALNHPSILMRLDHETFWESILELQKGRQAA